MTNKANFSIVQSKKGTEIVLSSRKLTKQFWIATILILMIGTALFLVIHGKGIPNISLTVLLLSLVVGTGVNLFIHYLFFGLFSPKGFRSVSVIRHKGGIYTCHCNAPIRMWQYRITCLTPVILLGILPFLYGMVNGYFHITELGLLMFLTAFDDVYILWQLRSFERNLFINDHYEEIRFQIDGK
ncbi:DUF3267 domain-containing protein [Bacteroides sp.]|uniref:DUF3267 domain-containing protein n=1 Tax=Bacteroides sp. TaxID=29523 RepID=UPI00261CD6A3|nr:DUF3267 domain-containing protein [Bacteroides sp.]